MNKKEYKKAHTKAFNDMYELSLYFTDVNQCLEAWKGGWLITDFDTSIPAFLSYNLYVKGSPEIRSMPYFNPHSDKEYYQS